MSIPSPSLPLPIAKFHTYPKGKRLMRFYNPKFLDWNTPRSKGPMSGQRFDHHPPPESDWNPESVWYASGSLTGSVAETFGRSGILDKNSGKRVCLVESAEPFTVIDLFGTGPDRFGLDQEICTTIEYERTQQWARAFYNQFQDAVGIRWRGRQARSENIILTDMADLLQLVLLGDYDISDPNVWPRIANAARRCRITII